MNTSQLLEAAADSIDQAGWWDGSNGDRGSTQCVLMGLAYASTMNGCSPLSAERALCQAVGVDDVYGLPIWNDASDQATVTSTMRAVAAIERAREQRLMPVVYREPVTA